MDRTPQPQLVRRVDRPEQQSALNVQTMNILKEWKYPYAQSASNFRDAQGIEQMKAFVMNRLGFDKSVFLPLLTLVGYDPIVHSSISAESVAVCWLIQCVHWADQTLTAELSPFTASLLSGSDVPIALAEPRSGLRARESTLPMTQNRRLKANDDKYIQRIVAIVSSNKQEELVEYALRELERNDLNLITLTDIDYLIFLIFRIRINYNDDSQRTKVNDQVCRFILLLIDMYAAQLNALAAKYGSVSSEHERHLRMYETSLGKVNCLKEDIAVLETQVAQLIENRSGDESRRDELERVCKLKRAENEKLQAEWETLKVQTGDMDAHVMKAREQEEINIKLQANVDQQQANVVELRERNRELRRKLLRKCAAVKRKYQGQEINWYMENYERGRELESQMEPVEMEQDVSQLLRKTNEAVTAINQSTYESLTLIYIDDKDGQGGKRADRAMNQVVDLYKSIKEKYQLSKRGRSPAKKRVSSQLLEDVHGSVAHLVMTLQRQTKELEGHRRQAEHKLFEEKQKHEVKMMKYDDLVVELTRTRDRESQEVRDLKERVANLQETNRNEVRELQDKLSTLQETCKGTAAKLDQEEKEVREAARMARAGLEHRLRTVQELLMLCQELYSELHDEIIPHCNRLLDNKAKEVIERIKSHQVDVVGAARFADQENIPMRRASYVQCIDEDELEGAVTARESLDPPLAPRVVDSLSKIFSVFTGRIGKQTDKRR